MEERITVTRPLLPPLDDFKNCLDDIWQRAYLTNQGPYHERLERALEAYLTIPYLTLFTNGTLPLIVALQALHISGEVITTPYSFVATTHAIKCAGCEPVFVDVDEITGNINPTCIERAITDRTRAIMAVHVYGNPCDTEAICRIARKHSLKVIYDAAHAFGVQVKGRSLLEAGDIATLSFHATKVYSTVEGGALVCRDSEMKQRVDRLKNFGFASECEVDDVGLNAKLDEVRSAFGLLTLEQVDRAIARRAEISARYRAAFADVAGLRCLAYEQGVRHNYSYFPLFVDAARFHSTRDELYEALKARGIIARRYFYPLISTFAPYRHLPSSDPRNLPVATRLANEVLCLPLHADLTDSDCERVIAAVLGD